MAEQLDDLLPTPAGSRHAPAALAWLRARLLPGGDGLMMLVAYVMILTALVSFILLSRAALPGWRFYGTVLALSALLVANIALYDLERRVGEQPARLTFLLASAALFLLANWLGGVSAFFPFLLFMIASQAFVTVRLSHAFVYSVVLAAAWLGVVWSYGVPLDELRNVAIQIVLGMLFIAIFSIVLKRYGEQTARAELLLRELRSANAELAAAREREKELAAAEERVRLARDIHDGLGHHLTVLNVQLQAASKLIERDAERAARAIAICKEEAQAALDEVRRSVAAMRRSPLDGRTLAEALVALVGDFDRHTALDARLELSGAPAPLPPAIAQTLYRAAQEGLTNAQKHAAAERVTVALSYGPANVRLVVNDDGVGAGNGGGGGFGLAGLRERAEQLGGDFSAGARELGGFGLEIVLPIRENEKW
jgi:signal transduction histidine kinase